MTRIARRALRPPVTCATLACLFALALGVGTTAAAAPPEDPRQMFDILDANGDGAVTREEFLLTKTEIFYRALKDLDRDQRLSRDEINVTPQAFADADLNGDGKISGAEFVQARFTQFEAIDANGDQEITFEELRDFMRQYRL